MATICPIADGCRLTLVAEGVLCRRDIIDVVANIYPNASPTHVLWDLTSADVLQLTKADFDVIAVTARETARKLALRKTAYAVANDTSYVALCKYLAAATNLRVPNEYAVFLKLDEADRWLRQE